MSSPPAQFSEYLVDGEPLRSVYTATLSDPSAGTSVSVGVTDRRLLCLAEDGACVTVDYDSISTIQSNPRTMLRARGNDYRLGIAGGAFLTGLGLSVLVGFAASPLVVLFGLLTVVGVAGAVATRRADGEGLATLADLGSEIDVDLADLPLSRRTERRLAAVGEDYTVPFAGCALIAAGSVLGLVAFAAGPIAVLAAFALVAGLGLTDYAYRRRGDLDGFELVRKHRRDVTISTEDGRTVHISSDPSEPLDQDLNRLAFVDEAEQSVGAVSPHT